MDVGKGDFLECVNDGKACEPASPLVIGQVYTVATCYIDGFDRPSVTLEEVATPRPWAGFCLDLFRRHGPRRGAFDDLLNVRPARDPLVIFRDGPPIRVRPEPILEPAQ